MKASASGQPTAFRFCGSHWSFLPTRYATLPKQVVLDEQAGIVEVAGGGLARLAGVDPLLVMPQRRLEPRLGRLETLELVLGQQEVAAVVGQQHALLAIEQHAQPPLVQVETGRRLGPLHAVGPDQRDRRPVGDGRMLPGDDQPAGVRVEARPGWDRRGPRRSAGRPVSTPRRADRSRGCPCRRASRCRSPTSGSR